MVPYKILSDTYSSYLLLPLFFVCLWGENEANAQEAQTKRKLRVASQAYTAKEYDKAQGGYTDILKIDSVSVFASYGMANTLYAQGKYEEAMPYYQKALERQPLLNANQLSDVLHNMGNIAMKSKRYDTAIELYQKALIQNPLDDDTRYNLVLAQKLNKKDENKQNEDKDKQDENKEQNKQENQQDNKSPQQQDKQPPSEEKNKQQPKNQPNPSSSESGGMTPEQAEQILNAFKQNDEQTRKRVEQELRERERRDNNQVRRKW